MKEVIIKKEKHKKIVYRVYILPITDCNMSSENRSTYKHQEISYDFLLYKGFILI